MTFNVLSPGDTLLEKDASQPRHTHYSGHREHSQTSKDQDYTDRTGEAPNIKKNPVLEKDEATKDIDDMTDPKARKREFSRRAETSDTQLNNEADFMTYSERDNTPEMDAPDDAVRVPQSNPNRQRQKANKWHYDSSNTYVGELR